MPREDQQLKLEIRDYILQEKNDLLKNCKDKQQAQQIISANAESLENLANEVLEAHGKVYRAQVQVGKSTFPDKNYGAICYPAGEYDAVRIVLGRWRRRELVVCHVSALMPGSDRGTGRRSSGVYLAVVDLVGGYFCIKRIRKFQNGREYQKNQISAESLLSKQKR